MANGKIKVAPDGNSAKLTGKGVGQGTNVKMPPKTQANIGNVKIEGKTGTVNFDKDLLLGLELKPKFSGKEQEINTTYIELLSKAEEAKKVLEDGPAFIKLGSFVADSIQAGAKARFVMNALSDKPYTEYDSLKVHPSFLAYYEAEIAEWENHLEEDTAKLEELSRGIYDGPLSDREWIEKNFNEANEALDSLRKDVDEIIKIRSIGKPALEAIQAEQERLKPLAAKEKEESDKVNAQFISNNTNYYQAKNKAWSYKNTHYDSTV